MNATTTPAKAQTVSLKPPKTVKAPQPIATEATNWRELFHAVRAKVGPILAAVQDRLEESGNAESGYRLPCIAEMMLDDADIDKLSLHDPLIYNIHALIRSAMGTPGEEIDDVSRSLLDQALGPIDALMYAMAETPRAEDIAAVNAALAVPFSAPKPLQKATKPAAYTRPVQTFFPTIGKTAEERLATLRATLHTAEEKLEAAYDAAERGTAVDTLLHLVAHDLLCDVMRPELMGAEGAPGPNQADLDEAQLALFPVLACIEGAMALSMGSVISATLAEAYNLLDWAQNECDGAALGALLPEFDRNEAFNRGRDLAVELLKKGQHLYAGDTANAQRKYRTPSADEVAPAQLNFVQEYLDKVGQDSTLSFGFSSVLSAALTEQPTDDPESYRVPMADYQAGKPGEDETEAFDNDNTAAGTGAIDMAKPATKTGKAEWWRLDLIDGVLNSAEIMNDMILDTCQFAYTDPDECEQAQERIILLARAVDGYMTTARTDLQEAITLAQKAGHA